METFGLENEVCVCGHGAGHHFLAWLSWKRGKQTTSWCTYESPDGFRNGDCACKSFMKVKECNWCKQDGCNETNEADCPCLHHKDLDR